MKSFKKYSIVFLCGSAYAVWLPFGREEIKPQHTVNKYDVNFDATRLLDRKLGTSDVHVRAFTGLQKLDKKSSCHRIALRLYAANCRVFDNFSAKGDGGLIPEIGDRVQDYIDSFSASLAICDLETAHATVPQTCALFQESILSGVIAENGAPGLHASHDQIRQCLRGLHSNHNAWTSFNSNKDTAALLCLLPRHDIDRDNLVSVVESIISILSDVNLSDEHRKEARAEEELVTSKHFQNIREQLIDIKDGVLSMWEKISSESTDIVESLMNTITRASNNLEATDIAMKAILKSLIEGNAEHALAQQQAVVATSDLTVVTQNAAFDFRQLMVQVGFNVTAMGIALAAMEQRHAEILDEHANQVQVLLNDVRDELHHTREVISEVKDNAERSAQLISKSPLSMLSNGPGGISWPLFVMAPIMSVVLVGYGLPASYTRNVGLIFTGIMIAKGLTMALNGQLHAEDTIPSSGMQVAHENIAATIIADSLDFERLTSLFDDDDSNTAPDPKEVPPRSSLLNPGDFQHSPTGSSASFGARLPIH